MNDVIIAVNPEHSNELETLVHHYEEYSKVYKNDKFYFTINDTHWEEEYGELEEAIIRFLHRIKKFAFIRMGDDINDLEIHGNLKDFLLEVSVRVDY